MTTPEALITKNIIPPNTKIPDSSPQGPVSALIDNVLSPLAKRLDQYISRNNGAGHPVSPEIMLPDIDPVDNQDPLAPNATLVLNFPDSVPLAQTVPQMSQTEEYLWDEWEKIKDMLQNTWEFSVGIYYQKLKHKAALIWPNQASVAPPSESNETVVESPAAPETAQKLSFDTTVNPHPREPVATHPLDSITAEILKSIKVERTPEVHKLIIEKFSMYGYTPEVLKGLLNSGNLILDGRKVCVRPNRTFIALVTLPEGFTKTKSAPASTPPIPANLLSFSPNTPSTPRIVIPTVPVEITEIPKPQLILIICPTRLRDQEFSTFYTENQLKIVDNLKEAEKNIRKIQPAGIVIIPENVTGNLNISADQLSAFAEFVSSLKSEIPIPILVASNTILKKVYAFPRPTKEYEYGVLKETYATPIKIGDNILVCGSSEITTITAFCRTAHLEYIEPVDEIDTQPEIKAEAGNAVEFTDFNLQLLTDFTPEVVGAFTTIDLLPENKTKLFNLITGYTEEEKKMMTIDGLKMLAEKIKTGDIKPKVTRFL